MIKNELITINDEQKKSIEYNKGPLLIIAGAGTGKTFVIVEKIKYIIKNKLADPENILALTFTEKASLEMEDRVDKVLPYGYFPMWISTFHSFADKILRDEIINIGLSPSYKLLTEAESIMFIKSNLFEFKLNYYRPLGNPQKFIEAIYHHFSRLKDEYISPQEYSKWSDKKQSLKFVKEEKQRIKELARAYDIYQKLMIKHGYLDFSDLMYYLLKLFERRKNILSKYRKLFKYVLVDEFQDTNIAQYILLKMLFPQENNPKLTVVGDDSQAIYKFRGASVSNILTFMKDYPKSKLVSLRKNYRSNQEILNGAYQLIQKNNPDTLESKLKISKNLIAQKKYDTNQDEKIDFFWGNDINEETNFVANKIIELKKNISYSDIAILARANNHADAFAKAFSQKGIPYQFLGPGILYRQPEIKDLIAYLNILTDINDSVSLYRVLDMDIFGISKKDIVQLLSFTKKVNLTLFDAMEIYLSKHFSEINTNRKFVYNKFLPILYKKTTDTLHKIYKIIAKHLGLINKESAGQILYYFLEESGYLNIIIKYKTLKEEKISLNISKFFKRLKQFESDHEDSSVYAIVDFLKISMELGESPTAQEIETPVYDAVNILTVHGSKGLEFPVVFLINLTRDRFPTKERKETIPISDDLIKEILPAGDYHLQEERRLFYVGMTRAMNQLFFTASKWYGEAKRERKLSPFVIDTLGEEFIKKNENIFEEDKKQMSIFEFKRKESQLRKNKVFYKQFSFSQINTFLTCPLKYKYSYILSIPVLKNASMIFGETIHKTLQTFYLEYKKNNATNLKRLLEIYQNSWIPLGYESIQHQNKNFYEGKKILIKYYKKFHNKNITILDIEKNFKIKIDKNLIISGKMDRIDRIESNKIEIIDYKTSKKPDTRYIKNDLQLSIYFLAATNKGILNKNPENITLTYIYLQDQNKISFSKKAKDLLLINNQIKKIVKNIKKDNFSPKKGTHCKFCPFRMICEAWQ